MTGFIVLTVIALALVAALEPNHRRRSDLITGLAGSTDVDDRDVWRISSDLRAVASRAPADPKPVALAERRLDHRPRFHGRPAA